MQASVDVFCRKQEKLCKFNYIKKATMQVKSLIFSTELHLQFQSACFNCITVKTQSKVGFCPRDARGKAGTGVTQ